MIRIVMAEKDEKGDPREVEWKIGEVVEFNPDAAMVLEADGDELSGIIRDFHNLPFHNGRLQVWYGDMAKMVAERTWQLSDKNRKEQARRERNKAQ